MKKKPLLTFFCLFLTFQLFAQDDFDRDVKGKNDTIRVAVTKNDEGVFLPWIVLPDVQVRTSRVFISQASRDQYNRLRRNVLKVLPYALFARQRYAQLNTQLQQTKNKKEQKRLVKACEKEIKDMFNREIKNMTITQGEILIKLIDRETGNSTYELIKDMRGGFAAFFYQSMAKVVGHDLKQRYDPQQERDIENIIQSSGYFYNSARL